ncbi:MAG: flagellar basal body L-ring protein FlgH [Minwuia sp.]|uniref:flagellar basal body L-ring protein FlgH n=1 Tax=Minwuia sp. TaxID=2493630 RepID=UPI003A895578
MKLFHRIAAPVLLAATLSACGAVDRVANIGKAPDLAPIEDPRKEDGFRTVSLPMPRPEPVMHQANSLWRPGARAFFKDQRAAQIGDILTVVVAIQDDATLNNSTTRNRTASEDADVTQLFGLQGNFANFLPDAVDPASLVSVGNTSNHNGVGTVDRQETINLQVAALVVDVLPNGNLVIAGRQEVRVNFEVRDLRISGVVRPQDITNTNTVQHSQIAEARIAYGGRGQLTDVQQPRYGQQLIDVLMPF